tara:strand:+ start:220 stop:687 length:468 start_codon:yes stop_codon:yes gene_type:complete
MDESLMDHFRSAGLNDKDCHEMTDHIMGNIIPTIRYLKGTDFEGDDKLELWTAVYNAVLNKVGADASSISIHKARREKLNQYTRQYYQENKEVLRSKRRMKYANETAEEREERKERHRLKMANETPEEKQERLARMRPIWRKQYLKRKERKMKMK